MWKEVPYNCRDASEHLIPNSVYITIHKYICRYRRPPTFDYSLVSQIFLFFDLQLKFLYSCNAWIMDLPLSSSSKCRWLPAAFLLHFLKRPGFIAGNFLTLLLVYSSLSVCAIGFIQRSFLHVCDTVTSGA